MSDFLLIFIIGYVSVKIIKSKIKDFKGNKNCAVLCDFCDKNCSIKY